MKYFLTMVILLVFNKALAGDYEMYYQVSPAAEQGHMFVLVLLENMNNENDLSTANFVIEPGEKIKKLMGHKDYPNIRYAYLVECIKEHGNVFIKTDVSVSDGDNVVFKSKQQLSGFVAP